MKFTSEDLMKAMGLQVGDRIRVNNKTYTIAKSEECQGAWIGYENENGWHNLDYLINGDDYEILPRPKRVGNLKCGEVDFKCSECPIRAVCLPNEKTDEQTFYAELELWNKYANDQEIYDLLKDRLDKEVLENDK